MIKEGLKYQSVPINQQYHVSNETALGNKNERILNTNVPSGATLVCIKQTLHTQSRLDAHFPTNLDQDTICRKPHRHSKNS